MNDEKLDAILNLVTVMNAENGKFRQEMNKFREETSQRLERLEKHAAQSATKLDRLEIKTDRIERQSFGIGYQVKDELDALEKRVATLELQKV